MRVSKPRSLTLPDAALYAAAWGVLFGRGWQLVMLDAPIRALLWNENLVKPWVTRLGLNWHTWVTNLTYDDAINTVVQVAGLILCAGGLGLATWHTASEAVRTWCIKPMVILACAVLCGLALCYYLDHFFYLGQLLEYALLVSTPALLLYRLQKNYRPRRFLTAVKVAATLTFVCHGLYAVGYYPQPGDWRQIAMNITGCNTEVAGQLLQFFGYGDFVAAILIWIPHYGTASVGWWYMIVWGSLSALARLVGTFQTEFVGTWLWQYLHNTLFRLCHGLVPLAGWWVYRRLAGCPNPAGTINVG